MNKSFVVCPPRGAAPRRRARALLSLAVLVGVALAGPTPTASADEPTDDFALDLATAIVADPDIVTGAHFVAAPPGGIAQARVETPVAGFPTDGNSSLLLTNGDASLLTQPNSDSGSGANLGGPSVRGNSDFDVTILRVDLDVPAGNNCLVGLDFKFLSEEYPEYVGSAYNDAFVAELDQSTWTTSGSGINAPDNFAFDVEGNPITINSTGVTGMTPENAVGTTYDGATPLLTAATPITPGTHHLYLSIFDQGDHVLDSAVLLDNLRVGHVGDVARDCRPGAHAAMAAQVLVVHGVTQDANTPIFESLAHKVRTAVPGVTWQQFSYFQDKSGDLGGSCDGTSGTGGDIFWHDTQIPPGIPADTQGMPYDTSQNLGYCDSQGDVGQNAFRLDQKIQQLYQSSGQKVVLVGYSMGGFTIRNFLAYSMSSGDGVAENMVDSVVTVHGVQQGSWIAGAGQGVRSDVPVGLRPVFDWVVANAAPDPGRPANQQFAPSSSLMSWMHAHSTAFPDIPFYNTWGDERIRIEHCFVLGHHGCVGHDSASYGDIILLPGNDDPTDDTVLGGHRFMPKGYTASSWQWREPFSFTWDPISDPTKVTSLKKLWDAPQQHSNIPNHQGEVTVTDCQTGQPVAEDEQLAKVIIARLGGGLYSCDPGLAS